MKSMQLRKRWFWPMVAHGLCAILVLMAIINSSVGATFPGNSNLTVSDPSGALSWNSSSPGLTIQCWFKISIPSGTNLTQNMVILANGTSGSESQYAYLVRFNIANGNVEFVAQGDSGTPYTNILIHQPYQDRWYHVAVKRQASVFTGYLDGREVFSSSGNVGNSANSSGLSIGGWGNGKYLYGDVQEVSVYQNPLSQDFIAQYMYEEQPTNDPTIGLVGYFPVGYSTNATDELANFAPSPVPNGTSTLTKQGNVTFEETDQGGEQSAFDANRNGGRNALVPLSGAFTWQQTAFARPTPGVAMDFRFGYSSANSFGGFQLGGVDPYGSGPLGTGWRCTFETRVIPSQTFLPWGDVATVGLMRWDGSIVTWDANDPNAIIGPYHTRSGEYEGELLMTATNCQWTTPQRIVYVFRRPDTGTGLVMRGRLTSIHDFNNNTVQVLYNQVSGVITQVVDSVGGVYNFNYQGNLLTNLTFGAWQLNFGYNGTNHLTSKSLVNTSGQYADVNTTWQFRYGTNGLLSKIIDPRGNTNVFVQYDQYGRMTNQMDALGRATAYLYKTPGERQITRIDPGTNTWVDTYTRKGYLLSEKDPLTNTTSYTYDQHGNRTSVKEPLGWTTYFGYDDRANVIARTNALNEVTHWVIHPFFNKPVEKITSQPPDANGWTTWTNHYQYDAAGNLTNHYDALGSLVSYTYYTNGLVHTSTDADGHTTTFTYDTNGFLFTKTDPATNITTFYRNAVNWVQRKLDALKEPTTYHYDLNGNVTRMVDPLTRVFYRTYDANGNLLSSTDGKGKATTYGYDAANQRTNKVDRTGTNVWQYFYTERGKLDHVTDPLEHSVTNIYDADNRLIQISDPQGHWVTNQYDADGNLTYFFDKLGKRWSKTYDRLDRLQTEADPLGNTKQTLYDVAGRIRELISPNSYPSFNTYDGRGRLTTWVDPQNHPWHYDYDGVGNITNITDANLGHYVMAYNSRNERTMERNQDNFEWYYHYDELDRLKQETNANQVVRTATYDAGGRLRVVDFSTGREDTFDYDDNDNMRLLTRSDASGTTSVQLIYNTLDQIQEEDGANNQTVLYGHDPLGRVTTITYPGNLTLTNYYDALGRLTNQVDWAGHQMSYTYDLADRLRTRRYPNGVVETNGYDDAGRLTALSYASSNNSTNNPIQIALSYAYDHNGNKTGGSESGTLNWSLPPITDEHSGFTPAGRLTTRQITETSPSNSVNSITYHYDANGNMTNASGNGQSWTLTYDEDNRTTSICWGVGVLCDKDITNRYDALGRRVSKTVDGTKTAYVLDLSSSMERILCDLDANGNVTARYVYGPDLCYRVDATNGLICYHADAMGNIIALTGGNTNLVAEYAYTPYGRCLGLTNFESQISNPYLFAGSQGVMNEFPDLAGLTSDPGLYFMRARYYSANEGKFLSTDSVKHIGAGWEPVAYTYSGLNPISNIDPNGNLFVEDDLWYLGIGAAAGFVSTAAEGIIKWHRPSLQEFAANSWGSAVEYDIYANTLLITKNPITAGYAGGAANSFAKDTFNAGVDSLTGTPNDETLPQLISHMNAEGALGAVTSPLSKFADVSGDGGVIDQIYKKTVEKTRVAAGQQIMGSVLQNGLSTAESSSGGRGGGTTERQSIDNQTLGAACYASYTTAANSTPHASATSSSGNTSSSGGGSSQINFNLGSTSQNNQTGPYSTPMLNQPSTQTSSQSSNSSGGWFGSILGLFGIHWP